MRVSYEAHGRAKRYTHESTGELTVTQHATVSDMKRILDIPKDTLIRGIVDGEAVPDSHALKEGMHVGLVILVTAG